MAVGGQRHDPAALSPGKTQYSLCRRMGGPQGRSGMVQKTLPPSGFGTRIVPARSESVYRQRYSGPRFPSVRVDMVLKTFTESRGYLMFQ